MRAVEFEAMAEEKQEYRLVCSRIARVRIAIGMVTRCRLPSSLLYHVPRHRIPSVLLSVPVQLYFNAKGRGELIRHIFAAAQRNYDDVRYDDDHAWMHRNFPGRHIQSVLLSLWCDASGIQ